MEGKGKVWGKVTRDSLKKGKMDNVRVDAFRLLFIHLFMSFIYFVVVYLSIYSRYFNSVCVPCLYLFPFSLSRHPLVRDFCNRFIGVSKWEYFSTCLLILCYRDNCHFPFFIEEGDRDNKIDAIMFVMFIYACVCIFICLFLPFITCYFPPPLFLLIFISIIHSLLCLFPSPSNSPLVDSFAFLLTLTALTYLSFVFRLPPIVRFLFLLFASSTLFRVSCSSTCLLFTLSSCLRLLSNSLPFPCPLSSISLSLLSLFPSFPSFHISLLLQVSLDRKSVV